MSHQIVGPRADLGWVVNTNLLVIFRIRIYQMHESITIRLSEAIGDLGGLKSEIGAGGPRSDVRVDFTKSGWGGSRFEVSCRNCLFLSKSSN